MIFTNLEKKNTKLKINYDFGKKTWFGTGGNSSIFIKVNTLGKLIFVLRFLPKRIPIFVLGAGSNIIIRDGGYKGIVLKLGKDFSQIKVNKGSSRILVGSAVKDAELAKFCQNNNIGGLEFLKGIPGTIGGNIKMNAGCYGNEISDFFISCRVIDRNSKIKRLTKDDLRFSYRKTSIHKNLTIIDAEFRYIFRENSLIKKKLDKISVLRKNTQPFAIRTGGSTFRNPNKKQTAWRLIDSIGYRGKKLGGAKVSQKHSNFLINENNASSLDIELLGEDIKEKIKKKYNVNLEWEIERIGCFKKI